MLLLLDCHAVLAVSLVNWRRITQSLAFLLESLGFQMA